VTLICYRSAIVTTVASTLPISPGTVRLPRPTHPRMFISKLSPEQWAEARCMRADGAGYEAIGDRFGVRARTVSTRSRREGWPVPAGVAPRRPARARPGPPPSPGTTGIRSRLAERLYRVIECRIRMMELRMIKQLQAQENDPDASVPPAPGKDERENFAALIDSISKVTEMASESAPAANGRRRTATATGAINPELTALSRDIDPDGLAVASKKDDFRRELAEHLGKMFPKP
jgi:hypothetical protein